MAIIIDKSPLLKFKFFIIVISAFVIIENTPIKDNISPVIWYKFVFSMLSTDDIIIKNQECLALDNIATIKENINGVITIRIGKFLIKKSI